MGCEVNGPGECRDADLGLAGAGGKFAFFKHGKIYKTVEQDKAVEEIKKELPDNFYKKRKIGENDEEVCKLIQKDLIEEFIIYVNKNDTNLKKKIEPSVYETNSFLMLTDVTLIEYAAFFGSSQVFKYLYKNGVPLTPSLWNYAIHGNNPELILILKEERVNAEYDLFEFSLREAIKCHHNGVANFICENLIDDKNFINYSDDYGYSDNLLFYSFHYYNYKFFS